MLNGNKIRKQKKHGINRNEEELKLSIGVETEILIRS